jgi:hypothetical protein
MGGDAFCFFFSLPHPCDRPVPILNLQEWACSAASLFTIADVDIDGAHSHTRRLSGISSIDKKKIVRSDSTKNMCYKSMNMQSKALLIALVAISCTGWNRVVEASLRQANYGLVSANHHENLLSKKVRWLFASKPTTSDDDDGVSGNDDGSSTTSSKTTTTSTTTATDDDSLGQVAPTDDSITNDDTEDDDSPSEMKTTSNSTFKSASNKTTLIEDDDFSSGTSTTKSSGNATKDDESDDYVVEYDLTNTTKNANSTKINIDFSGNDVPHKNGWIGAGLLIGAVILVCSQYYNGKRSQYQPISNR